MRIYFTRHGETEWNKLGIIQGQLDSALTSEGIEMGKRLREMSKDLNFDKVYSSDLGRAYDTARLICPDREIIKTPPSSRNRCWVLVRKKYQGRQSR